MTYSLKTTAMAVMLLSCSTMTMADPDSDFKAFPQQRFAIATGDGNYKQAYHWTFNATGTGPAVVVFLKHGSGGEWYKNISSLGPCGKDYSNSLGDYAGSAYEGLCSANSAGQRTYLADFNQHHVPVGPEMDKMMKRSIVGSSAFAAWYWQDAFKQFNSPVHVFMVGRYTIAKDPAHLNNALFWLTNTDPSSVSRDTLPPYNFDGDGLSAIDGDDRPFHTAPDVSAFDTMFLYKAVRENFPDLDLSNLVIEGRSNGGSAMIALVADPKIWPSHIRDFWSRNLAGVNLPAPQPQPVTRTAITLDQIQAEPALAVAFEQMLQQISREDLLAVLNAGQSLQLFAADEVITGTAGQTDNPPATPAQPTPVVVPFDPATFRGQLTQLLHGDLYQSVKLAHLLYPGCRLDGYMEQDPALAEGVVSADGASRQGYKVAVKTLFSFASSDSLYTSKCDDRVQQSLAQTSDAGNLMISDYISFAAPVSGQVFTPARHGFEYKDVNKNLAKYSSSDRAKAEQARLAIEKAVNTAIAEMGLNGSYRLPDNLN